MIFKDLIKKKIIIEKDQIFVIHKILGSTTKTPVGKYAIITNKAIILENGCVLNNGTYISTNEDLPTVTEKYGYVRQFKCLFSNYDHYGLNDFQNNFCNILKVNNKKLTWRYIDNKLHKSWQGKDLILNHDLRIHSIINLNRMGYGISLNNEKHDIIGNTGIISIVKESYLMLEIESQNFLI